MNYLAPKLNYDQYKPNQMKGILIILCFLGASVSFAQSKPGDRVPIRLQSKMYDKNAVRTKDDVVAIPSIFGDYSVNKYVQMLKAMPNKIDLNLIMGSLVRIQSTSITGDEINPMSFNIYEMETMTAEDYLFRVFGEEHSEHIEDLPSTIRVHKTDHAECYGILDLGNDGVAIPYKCLLLFLSRK